MLDRLELFNFKSYKGHVNIGPFTNFTAVIGPNGAGKSNVMDSISFVFACASTATLRGKKIQDLIYRGLTHASVYAVYIDEETKQETRFGRKINQHGSDYMIGERKVSRETYMKKLESISIFPKLQNFLVFQGEVEKIATMSAKDLTKEFEKISLSEEDNQRFANAKEAKEKAEEEENDHYQQKKGANAERQQYKEQQEEAEKWQAKREKYNAIQLEHVLFKCFLLDKELDESSKKNNELKEEINEKKKAHDKVEAEVSQIKKEHAHFTKECHLKLEAVRAKEKEGQSIAPEMAKVEEQISGSKKKSVKLVGKLERAQKSYEESQAHINLLKTGIEETQNAQKAFEDSQSSSKEVQLKIEQAAEYKKVKERVREQNVYIDSEVAHAKKVLDSCEDEYNREKERADEIKGTINQRNHTIKSYTDRLVKMEEETHSNEEQLDVLEKKVKVLKTTRDKVNGKVAILEERENIMKKELREARADKNESNREKKLRETLDSLLRLFTGVHGRLTDLCTPISKKYENAIAVVLGKNMNAVVVDNMNTARECVKYLKEQRMGTALFLPLDSIKSKPVNDKYRKLGGTTKLVVDVVKFEPAYEKAVESVCGNAIVCDSYKEASKLCFGGSERYKCVTVDGTFIRKSGIITGGVSGNMQDKTHQWGQKAVRDLKAKRQKTQDELAELRKQAVSEREIYDIESKIVVLKQRKEASFNDVNVLNRKLKELNAEKTELEKVLKFLKVSNLEKEVESAKADVEKLETKRNLVVDKLFADFCISIGVASIREFEGSSLREAQEANKKRLDFETNLSKLKNELEYEKSRNTIVIVEEFEKQTESEAAYQIKLEGKLDKLTTKKEKFETELKSLKEGHMEASKIMREKAAGNKELYKELSELREQVNEVESKLPDFESEVESIKEQKQELLLECKMNQIEIPLQEDETEMDVDEDDLADANVNYDDLSQELKEVSDATDVKSLNRQFNDKLQRLKTKIDSMAPNLRAVEKHQNAKQRVKELDATYKDAVENSKNTKKEFEKAEKNRIDKFLTVFNIIKDQIGEIYKHLTEVPGQVGQHGIAELILENESDPFGSGIDFSAMPPGKPYRSMEQLSGGEKTVAALALLFAKHSYQPSPFFILDEIDAALDPINVEKTANYIKRRSSDFQCLVISLKDVFYCKADSLVGVWNNEQASTTITLDLTKFEKKEKRRKSGKSKRNALEVEQEQEQEKQTETAVES